LLRLGIGYSEESEFEKIFALAADKEICNDESI
jgi:hypothetical protein